MADHPSSPVSAPAVLPPVDEIRAVLNEMARQEEAASRYCRQAHERAVVLRTLAHEVTGLLADHDTIDWLDKMLRLQGGRIMLAENVHDGRRYFANGWAAAPGVPSINVLTHAKRGGHNETLREALTAARATVPAPDRDPNEG